MQQLQRLLLSAGQRGQLGRRDKGGPAWRLRCRPRHAGQVNGSSVLSLLHTGQYSSGCCTSSETASNNFSGSPSFTGRLANGNSLSKKRQSLVRCTSSTLSLNNRVVPATRNPLSVYPRKMPSLPVASNLRRWSRSTYQITRHAKGCNRFFALYGRPNRF